MVAESRVLVLKCTYKQIGKTKIKIDSFGLGNDDTHTRWHRLSICCLLLDGRTAGHGSRGEM